MSRARASSLAPDLHPEGACRLRENGRFAQGLLRRGHEARPPVLLHRATAFHSDRTLRGAAIANDVPILLFVDDVAQHRRQVQELARLIARRGAKLRIIAAEDLHVWNVACDELEVLVSSEHETRYLGEPSIRLLLEKLEEHDCLGYLAPLSDNERLHELKHVHGRQLLVALLEATHGTPLVESSSANTGRLSRPRPG